MITILKWVALVLAVLIFPWVTVPIIAIYLIIKIGVKAIPIIIGLAVLGLLSKLVGSLTNVFLILSPFIIIGCIYLIIKGIKTYIRQLKERKQ